MPKQPIDLANRTWLRRDVLADGFNDRYIQKKLARGDWVRIRRGAYADSHFWVGLGSADRHRLIARAVLRTAHPSAVLSHVSAALEHGAPTWGIDLDEVHLTRTDGRPGRREAGIVHHSGALDPDDVMIVNGVPVTSAARAGLEVTTTESTEAALIVLNGLLHARATDMDEVRVLSATVDRWPHSLATRIALALVDGSLESAGESRAAFLFWAEHLPKPLSQVEVLDEHGRLVARVDFAWPEHGVFLEFDGREKYQRYRRPGESLEEFLLREKRREELVCLLTGWTCIRITWDDLNHPRRTATRIRRVLESRLTIV